MFLGTSLSTNALSRRRSPPPLPRSCAGIQAKGLSRLAATRTGLRASIIFLTTFDVVVPKPCGAPRTERLSHRRGCYQMVRNGQRCRHYRPTAEVFPVAASTISAQPSHV